jgi:GNAT superfamily N-acetyltransferase
MSLGILPDDIRIYETTMADVEPLRRMFYRLSTNSIYYWLGIGAPHTPHFADHLAAYAGGDGITQAAVVAWHGDEIVGIACYVCDDNSRANVAIIVEDAWQGRSLGRHLGLALAQIGVSRGVSLVTADILAVNQRALQLARRLLPTARYDWSQGECHIEGDFATIIEEVISSITLPLEIWCPSILTPLPKVTIP